MSFASRHLSVLLFIVVICVVGSHQLSHQHHNNASFCERPWPSMDIFLVAGFPPDRQGRWLEWYHIFFQSFLLFWPIKRSKVTATFVIDGELEGTPVVRDNMISILESMQHHYEAEGRGDHFPAVRLKYQHHPVRNGTDAGDSSLQPYRHGYLRQQYVGFLADTFTDATFVSIVDTDTVFHSLVDREDIFEGGKPIIHGMLQNPGGKGVKFYFASWMKTTYQIVRRETPVQCMTYFPVTIKAEHLRDLREYLVGLHRVNNFDAFFASQYSQSRYCQFCIMCTYLFWFKRDEYVWRVRDTQPSWDGNTNPRPPNGYYGDKSIWKPGEAGLHVYVADHARYRLYRTDVVTKERNRHALYLQGLCSHPSDTWHHPHVNCSLYREKYPYFSQWFTFEIFPFHEVYGAVEAQKVADARLRRFEDCDFSYVSYNLRHLLRNTTYTQTDFDAMLTQAV